MFRRNGSTWLLVAWAVFAGAPARGEGTTKPKQEIPLDKEGHAIELFGLAINDEGTLVMVWTPFFVPIPNRGTIQFANATVDKDKSEFKGFNTTSKEGWTLSKDQTRIDYSTSAFSSMNLKLKTAGDPIVRITVQTNQGVGKYQFRITKEGLEPMPFAEERPGKKPRK